MSEPPPSPDSPRPSKGVPSLPGRDGGNSRSAPAPAPSILDLVGERTGRSARLHLPDEGSTGAASPIVDASADPSELPSGRGNYQVLGEIARGGMGAIYRSHDTDLGRDVAMKVLLEEHADSDAILQRFVEEAQIGGQLQHPGIVPVYELGLMADERPYFTMKLVKGRTLAKLLSTGKDGADDRRRLLGIFEKVCETVAYAHARKVIHRDLKPANIMVGAFGEVQVVDWGLAKVLREGGVADERPVTDTAVSLIETVRSSGSTAAGTQSLAGSVLGTPAYMPPEQAQGRIEQVDERADVFGLGAILCEILTGTPPYRGKHDKVLVEATKALQDDALERLAACGAEDDLVELVTECIAPARAARPADAAAVLERVQASLVRQQQRAREADEAAVRALQERKARRLTLALAATILLAVVAGGFGYLSTARAADARREQTSRQVDALLEEAGVERERGDFEAALDACARADVALGTGDGATGDGDTTLSARIARARERAEAGAEGVRLEQEREARIADFVGELDDIVYGAGSEWSSRFADEWRARRLTKAFAGFGLDPLGEDPDVTVSAIEATGQTPPIVVALDEWSRLTRSTKSWRDPDVVRLTGLAARLDRDPARSRLRTAVDEDDIDALAGIVSDADGADWPPATVAMLFRAMQDMGLRARSEEILRACQQRYPSNSHINYMLADWLSEQPDPDAAEVLRYLTAAQAASDRPGVATGFLCSVLRQMGRVDEALETHLAAIRAIPGATWLAGGSTLRNMLEPYPRDAERRAVRRRAHEAYLAAAPWTASRRVDAAWFHVGSSDPVVRDPALALEILEPAMTEEQLATLDPRGVREVWSNLGVIQYLLGRDADAVRSMETALRLGEEADDEWAERELVVALALHRLGRAEQARAWYQRALALREPPEDRNPFWGETDFLWAEGAEVFGE